MHPGQAKQQIRPLEIRRQEWHEGNPQISCLILFNPVYPSDLDMLKAFRQVAEHLARCNYSERLGYCQNQRFVLHVHENRSIHAGSFCEFLEVLDKHPRALPLGVHSHWQTQKLEDVMCGIDVSRRSLEVSAEAADLNTMAALHDKVRDIFDASAPQPEKSPYLSRCDIKKSVFVAHRFDEAGKAVAERLMSFLRRLGYDVAEGAGYEARDIPGKVADRIRSQDIFLCLATQGDTSWLLSEAAFAKAMEKYLIILCQEGVQFNKGILGSDHENLSFARGNVEKVFCDLLYALPT